MRLLSHRGVGSPQEGERNEQDAPAPRLGVGYGSERPLIPLYSSQNISTTSPKKVNAAMFSA